MTVQSTLSRFDVLKPVQSDDAPYQRPSGWAPGPREVARCFGTAVYCHRRGRISAQIGRRRARRVPSTVCEHAPIAAG